MPGPPGMPGHGTEHGAGRLRLDDAARRHAAASPQGPPNDLVAKLKANSIPKIVAGPSLHRGWHLYLAEDDEPQPTAVKKKPVATLDGGAVEGGLAAGSGSAGVQPQRGLGTDDAARDGPGPRPRRAGMAGRRSLPSSGLAAEHAVAVHAERHHARPPLHAPREGREGCRHQGQRFRKMPARRSRLA